MAKHSNLPTDLAEMGPSVAPGHDVRSLGPSDSSDTGADVLGPGLGDDDVLALDRGTIADSDAGHSGAHGAGSLADLALDDNSDREGTGERATAGNEEDIRPDNDIAPDRIVGAEEAGLGGGLDEAEEARVDPLDKQGHAGPPQT